MADISENLKIARKAAGMRQEDAANAVGMLRVTLSQIESGKRKVSSDELVQFAKLYHVDPDALLEYEKDGSGEAVKRFKDYSELLSLQEKFIKLNEGDREEILEIIDLKLRRYAK
jgi:transcriptional regulator with XRE-family HTH domain